MNLREWLEAAEPELEPGLLQSPPLAERDLDAAIVALNAGGRLRYVIDVAPGAGVRLRVKVIERGGSCTWWLADTAGRDAPRPTMGA